ncbi:hypothetical protein PAPYR_9053 [Paratrimastix pyriformis]|uniref:Uncharacterized protein n=1 Tax=Paratrimastix pyriformis TaxID=342808 RepID=A0ABQ8U9F0_9EUKA|nr:hypothetical protein PAPYR_9053 [Paratrimastix pyriformis]
MGSYHRPSSNSLKDQNPQQPPFRGSLLCIIACVYLLPWDRDTVADAIFALVESIGFYSTVSHLLRSLLVLDSRDSGLQQKSEPIEFSSRSLFAHSADLKFRSFLSVPSPRAVCSPRDHLALIPVSEGAGCWSLLTGTRWLAAVGCCDTKCMCIRGDGGREFHSKDGSVARKTLVPK